MIRGGVEVTVGGDEETAIATRMCASSSQWKHETVLQALAWADALLMRLLPPCWRVVLVVVRG
jgi:hypothetical protein